MRRICRYLLGLVLILLGLSLWARKERRLVIPASVLLESASAMESWFPNLASRVKWGAPDTWRNPEADNESIIDHDGVIDPIAERTFYMLKTGADVMWERLPVHMETTLRRFPYHQIYADTSAIVGNETVVDVIAMIPEVIIDDWLPGYRVRRQQLEESWGWDSRQIQKKKTEGWESDKYKNVPMMLHAFRNAPKHCDWFIFADDDTFIHSQSLGALLRDLNPRDKHYIGSSALIPGGISETGRVGEALKAKNPDKPVSLWFAHGGSGVIVSRGAVEAVFWDPQREDDTVRRYSDAASNTCCGDAVFALMLREELELFINDRINSETLRIDPFQGETLETTSISVNRDGFCSLLASWHHLESWEIQKLYEWEESLKNRKKFSEAGVLYSDVYHDFILPFISEKRDDWEIRARSQKFDGSEEIQVPGSEDRQTVDHLNPAANEDSCQRACGYYPQCFGWQYEYLTTMNNTCSLQFDSISRGVHSKKHDEGNHVVSGWMIDRIRKMRSDEICDKFEENKSNDEMHEGWYFSKLNSEYEQSHPIYLPE